MLLSYCISYNEDTLKKEMSLMDYEINKLGELLLWEL